MTDAPTLRTPRLVLRPWRDRDLDAFHAMSADPVVMEHYPSVLDRTQSDAWAARVAAHFAREGFGFWAIEVPGVVEFAGFAGLARPSWMPVIEVGWRLGRAHWGHGYATEGARAAVDWGFANLGIAEIVAFVRPDNLRSQRVMERLGMRRDPTSDFEHPAIPVGHPKRAHWLFRLSSAA